MQRNTLVFALCLFISSLTQLRWQPPSPSSRSSSPGLSHVLTSPHIQTFDERDFNRVPPSTSTRRKHSQLTKEESATKTRLDSHLPSREKKKTRTLPEASWRALQRPSQEASRPTLPFQKRKPRSNKTFNLHRIFGGVSSFETRRTILPRRLSSHSVHSEMIETLNAQSLQKSCFQTRAASSRRILPRTTRPE